MSVLSNVIVIDITFYPMNILIMTPVVPDLSSQVHPSAPRHVIKPKVLFE